MLNIGLWQSGANAAAMSRLLAAYINKKYQGVISEIGGILQIWKYLVSSTRTDELAMKMLSQIVQTVDPGTYSNALPEVMKILFERITSRNNQRFLRFFIPFVCLFVHVRGFEPVFAATERVQSGSFGAVFTDGMLPNLRVVQHNDKKLVAVGLTDILCRSPQFFNICPPQVWVKGIECTVTLMETNMKPADVGTTVSDDLWELTQHGYEAGFSDLSFARSKAVDPVANIQNGQLYMAMQLSNLSGAVPGQIGNRLQNLPEGAGRLLQGYFQAANVPLK